MTRFLTTLLAGGLACAACADTLPEPWQGQRDAGFEMMMQVCDGDTAALAMFRSLLATDPVAQNNAAWVADNCALFDAPGAELAALQLRAAEAGYPIAQANYANRLLGAEDDGLAVDPVAAVMWLERAIAGGYGVAAFRYGMLLVEGTLVPRDLGKARDMLRIARAEQAELPLLEQLEAALAGAAGTGD